MIEKKKKKIILIPYPAQGHVTPMLKLASVLPSLSFRPVVVTPDFIHRRISPRIGPEDGILCLPISDGLDDDSPRDFFAVERAMEENMPRALEQLIRRIMIEEEDGGGGGVACLVADLLGSWALDVARRLGVPTAGFWPAMHATYRLIAAIPRLIQTGVISENGCPRNPSAAITLSPIDPIFTANDLPWLVGSSSARLSRFKFWTRTLQRSKTLPWILTNTFPNESSRQPKPPKVLHVGPLIMQAATVTNAAFWEEDTSCLDWLDRQETGSVLYVSFGSWVSPIGDAKVGTLASTLEALGRPFLWVLGPTWRRGLPVGHSERLAAYGRIVSWAPQMDVLRHQAVGCYLTHCGWNSTVEAIQNKKPLLCYPIAGDQFLNCRYIVGEWKIGVMIEGFGVQEMEDGIKRIVENDEVSRRIERLNENFFGKEGSARAMSNLSAFLEDLHDK